MDAFWESHGCGDMFSMSASLHELLVRGDSWVKSWDGQREHDLVNVSGPHWPWLCTCWPANEPFRG